jgi:hypothetical protein
MIISGFVLVTIFSAKPQVLLLIEYLVYPRHDRFQIRPAHA